MNPSGVVLPRYGVRYLGYTYPCTIGKGRIKFDKREGDGAAPGEIHWA